MINRPGLLDDALGVKTRQAPASVERDGIEVSDKGRLAPYPRDQQHTSDQSTSPP